MSRLTRHIGIVKLSFYLANCAILFMALLFVPSFTPFERGGDNYFTVLLNGVEIGRTGDPERVEALLRQVRREIASESDEMVYIPVELTLQGQEVLFGKVDGEDALRQALRSVLKSSQIGTLKRAYTVKINEYTVNLESSQDVTALLQAVLDRYDSRHAFRVSLIVDPDRELNVLTTSVTRAEETAQRRGGLAGAGLEAYFEEILGEIEPDLEKSAFSSLNYGLLEMDFDDPVEIVEAYLPKEQLSTLDEALAEVTADQEKEEIYEVQAGDTLSEIAEEWGLTVGELIAINPMLESESSVIRVGDELVITVPEPELSVWRRECVYTEGSYEAETVYLDNDSWYTSRSEVRTQPSAGQRKAAALVTYRNDSALSEEIIKEEVVLEAVAKVVERGTKVPPTYIKPISGGRLSSGFGSRSAPTAGASTNHQGVDWATPVGTAVMASCGGTVTRAGWGSGYGYVVYIRHEDGRETRYGHLSKVLVSVGQKVGQGEKIALSGNTGRSTGPHLHFELRINGQAVNPLNYLN